MVHLSYSFYEIMVTVRAVILSIIVAHRSASICRRRVDKIFVTKELMAIANACGEQGESRKSDIHTVNATHRSFPPSFSRDS